MPDNLQLLLLLKFLAVAGDFSLSSKNRSLYYHSIMIQNSVMIIN
jgi:hypothetical protein